MVHTGVDRSLLVVSTLSGHKCSISRAKHSTRGQRKCKMNTLCCQPVVHFCIKQGRKERLSQASTVTLGSSG